MLLIDKLEPIKVKLFIFTIPFVIIGGAFLLRLCSEELFQKLFGFEEIGEWFQSIFYLLAACLGVITFKVLRSKNFHFRGQILMIIFFTACFFIAFEEISWGQHIFKWNSPELFQKINNQKETNIHNIKGMDIHSIFIFVGLVGGISWAFKINTKSQFTDFLYPDWQFSSYFFAAFLFYFYFEYINRYGFWEIGNHQEVLEFVLSLGFLLLALSNLQKAKHKTFESTQVKFIGTPEQGAGVRWKLPK